MKRLIYSIALALLFASCERTADIKVPENPPMMAAFCFLEVGVPIKLNLEEVVPVFSKVRRDPTPVSGATVEVIYESTVIRLVESLPSGTYMDTTGHQIQPGGHYTLRVSKSGFPSLESACTVPNYEPTGLRHEYTSVPDPTKSSDSIRRVGFYWKDQPGVNNYYRVAGVAQFPVNAEQEIYFSQKNIFDSQKDGNEIFSGLGEFYIYDTGTSINTLECKLELMVMDQHALEYMRSFDVLYYNSDNPFGEPVIAYTNIKGGLGVFGGLSRKFFTVKIY